MSAPPRIFNMHLFCSSLCLKSKLRAERANSTGRRHFNCKSCDNHVTIKSLAAQIQIQTQIKFLEITRNFLLGPDPHIVNYEWVWLRETRATSKPAKTHRQPPKRLSNRQITKNFGNFQDGNCTAKLEIAIWKQTNSPKDLITLMITNNKAKIT